MSVSVSPMRETPPSPAVTPPPGNPRFALFDSLRGIAVSWIIVVHVAGVTTVINRDFVGETMNALGLMAPTTFFAISGFLLYRPFVAAHAEERRRPSIARYARRRALRILPAYWTALTLLAIFPGIVGVFSGDWWRYYFFLQLYDERTLGQGIPVAWTLCVEVAFYICLPLVVLAARRLTARRGSRGWLRAELALLAAIAIVGVAFQVAAARQAIPFTVATALPGQCMWMALGMALAVASVAVERREREPRLVRLIARHPGLCWVIALAAFAGLVVQEKGYGAFAVIVALNQVQPYSEILLRLLLAAVVATGFMLPAIWGERQGGVPRRLLALAPLAWFGVISYSVYLYHLTVAQLLGLPRAPLHFAADGLDLVQRIDHATTLILLALTLLVTCGVAAVSYRLVELPFLRRKEPQ